MGFSPDQVRAMSLWDYKACESGYLDAHSPPEAPEPPSDEAYAEARRRNAAREARRLGRPICDL